MSENRLIELLAKKDAQEITLPEQKELLDLIKRHHELEAIANEFDFFNKQAFVFNQPEHSGPEQRWRLLEQELKLAEKNSKIKGASLLRLRKWMVAASLLLIITVGAIFIIDRKGKSINTETSNRVITKKGSKSYLVLPDGTKVWLNSATEISYDRSFGNKTREVRLSGEAYFDVTENKNIPFIVHTKQMDITVLGTAFNVNAYERNKNTETTLIRGSVEVTLRKHQHKKIILKPFEKIAVPNNVENKEPTEKHSLSSAIYSLNKVKKEKVDDIIGSAEILWTKNKLVFVNNTLDEIAQQLSLWYDVTIKITDDTLKAEKYNAEFDDATLEEVMQSLKVTGKFEYSINDRTITITP